MSVAILLNLACLVVFFQFVHRLATGLRPASLIQLAADRARPVIDEVFPHPDDPNRVEAPVRGVLPATPMACAIAKLH